MCSILLLSFNSRFSACRGRKLSETDQSQGLFVTWILRRIHSLSWGHTVNTESPTGSWGTLTLQTRWSVTISGVACELTFFLSQGKLTFMGGLKAEPLQMNKREGKGEKTHIHLTGKSNVFNPKDQEGRFQCWCFISFLNGFLGTFSVLLSLSLKM